MMPQYVPTDTLTTLQNCAPGMTDATLQRFTAHANIAVAMVAVRELDKRAVKRQSDISMLCAARAA